MAIGEGSVPLALPGGEAQVTQLRRPRKFSSSYGAAAEGTPAPILHKQARSMHRMAYAPHANNLYHRTNRLANEDTM